MSGGGFDIYAHLEARPGGHMTCPHCNGVAGTVPHPELIAVCKICGAPRIPMPEGMATDPIALSQLKKADKLRKKRGLAGGIAIVAGVFGAFGLLMTLITLIFSVFWAMFPALLFVAPAIAAILWARSSRKEATKDIVAALDAAWIAAGVELVRAGKVKTAADLSKVLGLDPLKAQQVFTLMSVDAEIGAPNVRIDAGPVVSQVPPDPRFAALEAQQATERQAEAEAAAVLDDGQAKSRTTN